MKPEYTEPMTVETRQEPLPWAVEDALPAEPTKRKRGRPRKNPQPDATATVNLAAETIAKTPKRTQSGEATSDVVVSAVLGGNASLFVDILKLHVPRGQRIADVTYGQGVFWQQVPTGIYQLRFSDLDAKFERDPVHDVEVASSIDARSLPFSTASESDADIDCLVLDPPYQEGLLRKNKDHMGGQGTHHSFRHAYSNGQSQPLVNRTVETWQYRASGRVPVLLSDDSKWHDAVLALYVKSGLEAYRVLPVNGTLIVKCQDEVSANKQRLTHVELITAYESIGFYCKDLFVLMRDNKPGVARVVEQRHARKNHSYFLVFIKIKRQQVSSTVRLMKDGEAHAAAHAPREKSLD